SSLEILHLVKELQVLVGARIDKIYHPEENELLIQVHIRNSGKRILRVVVPNFMYMTDTKEPSSKDPTEFCLYLRRKLHNAVISSITQKNYERIIELHFAAKDGSFFLLFELFSRGNIILCDSSYNILSLLETQLMKSRKIAIKEGYKLPEKEYSFFTLTKTQLATLLNTTNYDSIVKCLASETGLGGTLAEEICLISDINKNKKPIDVIDSEQDSILASIKNLTAQKPSPILFSDSDNSPDFSIFPMHNQDHYTASVSINSAIESLFCNFTKPKEPSHKKLDKIKKIIEEQEQLITKMETKESETKQKADTIYQNYSLLSSLLNELKEISKKHSWEDIKKKLQGHSIIKSVDAKEKA
ncbi:hypothetical protein COV16_06325, partial [Candidatus Woesearchaeota archaeon CG10_big_fil_rev_8_21_14_0_10_34_8]